MNSKSLTSGPIRSYKSSGKWQPIVFVLFPVMLIIAAATGALYQWLVDLNPLIYFNFLLCLGVAFVVGLATTFMLNLSKCRNAGVAAGLSLCLGLSAVSAGHLTSYYHWVEVYKQAAYSEIANSGESAKLSPKIKQAMVGAFTPTFLEVVSARVLNGWEVSFKNATTVINGGFVYLIWVIEAVLFIGLVTVIGSGSALLPFCESCQVWADHKVDLAEYAIVDNVPAVRLTQADSLEELFAKPVDTNSLVSYMAKRCLRYVLAVCPNCEKVAFLTITDEKTTVDSKGKEKKEKKNLWSDIELHDQEIDHLLAIHNPAFLDKEG